MIDKALRQELLSLQAEDHRVREELLAENLLAGPYQPRMETVHRKNAARLRELIEKHGWPSADIAGLDGAEAAWIIAQHSVGEPEFMKQALSLTRASFQLGKIPAWHAAYLEDRIALVEGRPQRFGTQSIDDPRDGIPRPWKLADPEHVDALRDSVGLKPLLPIPPPGPDLPIEQRRENEATQKWWLDWLASRGWRARSK